MEIIYFTKFLKGLNPKEIGQAVKNLGFDGLDLAIRAGQWVNPTNVTGALPQAMVVWHDLGLSVPMATLEGSAIDPHKPEIETIYAACNQAAIPYIKLGYWIWHPGESYWEGVEQIRCALDGFQKLGERYSLCSLVHTHSTPFYGLNASAAMHLVRDFDPRYIGVYIDPGHLAADGEPLDLALAMVRDYLKMVGVKNVRYVPGTPGKDWRWQRQWCYLDEGLVDWANAIDLLRQAGFDGPLSVHGEYSASQETDQVLQRVAHDMDYLQRIMGRSNAT